MNDDLLEIEKEIQTRKQSQAVAVSGGETPTVPAISFDIPVEKREIQTAKDTTAELVESAFNQAVIHRVTTDESVQKELLDSA